MMDSIGGRLRRAIRPSAARPCSRNVSADAVRRPRRGAPSRPIRAQERFNARAGRSVEDAGRRCWPPKTAARELETGHRRRSRTRCAAPSTERDAARGRGAPA
ncbi:MAG: hypothetical protein MZV49_25015 [Rhodopseudomonas palustris]|nr:hypothetical protein [Rhodopseudomonas palustris]